MTAAAAPSPANTTALALRVDGAPLAGAARRALRELRLVQRACLPAQLVAVFDGTEPPVGAAGLATPVALDGAAGASGEALFEGEIAAAEQRFGPDRRHGLELRAYDALATLQAHRRPHAFAAGDLRQLAGALLAEHGLRGVDWPAVAIPARLVRDDADDRRLLHDVAVARGVYFHTVGGEVRAFTLADDGAAPVELERGILDLRVERSRRAGWSSRSTRYWDLHALTTHDIAGGGAPAGGEARSGGPRFAGHGDAAARAGARAREDAQRSLGVSGAVRGDPRLRPGRRIRLRHPALDEPVVTTLFEVVHRIDPDLGYVTEFTDTPPTPPAEAGLRLAFGAVVAVDPARPAEARLRLPWLDDLETGWLPVVVAGAGAGKGCVALPEPDDHVACLLYADNLADGMILGGLFAERSVPTGGGDGDRALVARTRAGQTLRLDDAAGGAMLGRDDGSRLELAADAVRLASAGDLDIAAPGRRIRIRAARIDFEEA